MSLLTYRGLPMLALPPQGTPGMREEPVTLGRRLDAGSGSFGWVAQSTVTPVERELEFVVLSRAAAAFLYSFLRSTTAGRATPFWLPTWRQDFTLLAPVGATDTSVPVVRTDYVRWQFPQGACRRHLVAITGDPRAPTFTMGSIAAAALTSPTVETLTLTAPLGVVLAPQTLLCFNELVRLETDEPTIRWLTGGGRPVAELRLRVRTLPQETPAP